MNEYQKIVYRCDGKIHGVRKEYPDGRVYLEVRCKDTYCADRKDGEVVFHYFDIDTGWLSHTRKFKDPISNRIRESGKAQDNRISKQHERYE